ncbi:MAG: hypothetical protein NWE91_04120 [Candidatus Bathyarchaeota archaeon]|nr:hypothetical protein [Candidatus Bathyarchaeota archaeon]
MKRRKKENERTIKIGIGIPCHIKDKHFLEACLQAIANLDPPPHTYLVDLNEGEDGLKGIRTRLFDKLFETCDVVLQCDVEFYLFPDILSHVQERKVTSFCHLTRSLVDIIKVVARFLSPNPWTGCYSLPKHVWQKVKISYRWDGTDTSIQKIASNYKFVYTPKYYILRRSPRRIQVALSDKSLLKKIRNLLLRGI